MSNILKDIEGGPVKLYRNPKPKELLKLSDLSCNGALGEVSTRLPLLLLYHLKGD